jgi:hypothetical protein
VVAKAVLELALSLYVKEAYPAGVPAGVQGVIDRLVGMGETVPADFFEASPGLAGNAMSLRLGQPKYPHMKLVVEYCGKGAAGSGAMFRVDTHDQHLHAPPGSPDEAWLQGIRSSNKEVTERIEAAWMAAGVPTFKGFLRKQLEERKKRG